MDFPNQSRITGAVQLTPTEKTVLEFIAAGMSSAEVADKMSISKRTVDFHLSNVYGKLDVHNRITAVNKARTLGLLQ